MDYQEQIRKFFESNRVGDDAGKACFWSLHTSTTPGVHKVARPLESNLNEDEIEASLDLLFEAIERQGPAQVRYFVVYLKNSKNDNGQSLPFKNPYFQEKESSTGIAGLGNIGQLGAIGILIQQSNEKMALQQEANHAELKATVQQMKLEARIKELEGEVEAVQTAKESIIDKFINRICMPLFEMHGDKIFEIAGNFLTPKAATTQISGTNIAHEQAQQAPPQQPILPNNGIDWQLVIELMTALKQGFQKPEEMLYKLVKNLENPQSHQLFLTWLNNPESWK